MALSNWDTLALEFEIREHTMAKGDPGLSDEAHRIEEATERQLEDLHARHGDDMQAIVDDEEYMRLIHDGIRARRIYEADLSPGSGTVRDGDHDWQVEIYKNYLHVGSPTRWNDSGGYIEPYLMHIEEGEISLGLSSLQIKAVRGPQNGVFALVYKTDYEEIDSKRWTVYRGQLLAGVYGFDDDAEWIGVSDESMDFLKKWLSNEMAEPFSAIDLSRAVRFNQGDAFFAAEFDTQTPTSAPGEAEATLFSHLIGGD